MKQLLLVAVLASTLSLVPVHATAAPSHVLAPGQATSVVASLIDGRVTLSATYDIASTQIRSFVVVNTTSTAVAFIAYAPALGRRAFNSLVAQPYRTVTVDESSWPAPLGGVTYLLQFSSGP